MAPGAILDLDDPGVGIEAELAHQAFFDLGLGSRLLGLLRSIVIAHTYGTSANLDAF